MEVIFALGSNGQGQLGIGHNLDVSVPKPAQILIRPDATTSPIVKVAAGGNHTLLLTGNGDLYGSGNYEDGACGFESKISAPAFQQLRLRRPDEPPIGPVALAAATWEASVIVAKDEHGRRTKIYTFGKGDKGELGLGPLIIKTPGATQINDFPPAETEIVDLAAGMGHVVAVLSNGDVYGWGNCRKGQAGEPAGVIHEPRKIEGVDFPVKRAVCCKEATCLVGESGSGKIRVLGADKWNLQSQAPETIPLWKDVAAAWGNIYILTTEGKLISWGRDDHGQLPPPDLPPLARIAVGSEHVVALSETGGDVMAWGWGEHGNCGPQVDNNNVKGRWNVIASERNAPGYTIANIGAGCATSWLVLSGST
ncbi:RCC1 domain-containing protein [Stachybotrys elegans]|uniref:RCC1 domain-containing protein n=1 Tax=Stachybotrys elegans TaxID=80388 RepID=A0A8K0SH79_9HYPO|nr:RCC1 domain-containing protein [Stachybotrys elegans]